MSAMRPDVPPTIAGALGWCRQQLNQSESPAADSRALLCHLLEKNAAFLMTWPDRVLSEQQWQQLQHLVVRRQQGEPVAYLTGQREFWSLPLKVNSSTLIPRPDTETLVATALALSLPADANVLDLGTGTGAIALALKSERPDWRITAVDNQVAAVELARENAQQLRLEIAIYHSDWLAELDQQRPFDLIVSNPPYIDEHDPHLQQGDVRFEPASALIAEKQGLADIESIAERSLPYLKAAGWLLIEHGWQQADAVVEVLSQNGYKHVNRWTDYGSVERVTGGQKAG